MPGIVDWRTTPLVMVDQIFHERSSNIADPWSNYVKKFFTEKLSSEWQQIPSLNSCPNHCLVDGQIVRFRGMIQDMFDPELYLSEYEFRDSTSGQMKVGTSRFREMTGCGEEDINFDSAATKNGERLSYFCVAIPGESGWATEGYKKQATIPETATSSSFVREKRGRDEDDDEDMDVTEVATVPAPSNDLKKTRIDGQQPSVDTAASTLLDAQQPTSVIVKLYDLEEGVLSLNDAVEFIGILSVDPSTARLGFSDEPNSEASVEAVASAMDIIQQFDRKEMVARHPPSSLVPRLHVLHFVKVDSGNPLLPVSGLPRESLPFQLEAVRSELHQYLTQLLLGDSLAADYLICHLVSKIYLRRDVLCLGKFSVNLFQVPLSHDYSKRISESLSELVSRFKYLPLTVENLNKLTYIPKKDYESNRLETGLLQLSPHTHLFLNETTLECGQLDAEGVKNLTALGNVITWQKCGYNFSFHNIEFQTDIPCLVLSEGRSMLSCDVQLLHKPDQSISVEEVLKTTLDAGALDRIRKYISFVRHYATFDVSDEMQTFVQEDFVRERSLPGGNSFTPDDLHSLLVLSRLMALSHGHQTLTQDIWQQAKAMEKVRKERMAHLPSRPH